MTGRQVFSEDEKQAVYRAIRQRRDVRRFLKHPVPDDVLLRILQAASSAPSVGYMQPWNFLLISDAQIRQEIHKAFIAANDEAKGMFEGGRKDAYTALKLEGIKESALNICVTCDRSRFGPVVLGRTCQPDMDLYSTVCAVQNLWLAARAEGIGVGWVSIIKPVDLQNILRLPGNVIPIAYLCVGYTDVFADEPELKSSGWLPEIPFSDLVFYNYWGNKSQEMECNE